MIELIKKCDIKDAYHLENKNKFAQTIRTPAITRQLMNELGFFGGSLECKAIL